MSREYPDRPVPAVGAVVVPRGFVLLAKRGVDPNRARWSVPGGAIEESETAEEAVIRETREECGVTVRPVELVAAIDVITRDTEGRVRFHYALLGYRADYVEGEPTAGDDVLDARWIPLRDLHEYDVTEGALEAIEATLRRRRG